MLSRWQAACSWALLAKGNITDASATLQSMSISFPVLGYVAACLTSFKKSLLGLQISPVSPKAARVSSRMIPPENGPAQQRGRWLTNLSGLVLRGLWWVCGIFHPHTATSAWKRVLNRFARRLPTARLAEEGEKGAVTAGHAAYQERSVPPPGLRPAEKGLTQLSTRRNEAKREYYVCRECFSGLRTVYSIMCLHLWVGVVLPAAQRFLRSC